MDGRGRLSEKPSMLEALTIFLAAAAISCAISPAAAWLALRVGAVSLPKQDRWHRRPTPMLGGIAIAAGTLGAMFSAGTFSRPVAGVTAASLAMFAIGLVDDRVRLGPTAKLVGSLAAGAGLVFFLGPTATRLPAAAAVVVAVAGFAGIVHAFNLLDNMDGLAAGVGAITAAGGAIVLAASAAPEPALLLVALAGALAGFLPWNTSPARMFMGDGGSLFIGSVIVGALLIPWIGTAPGRAFNLLAILLVFVVPVGEVVFVSALRWMAGRNPTRGGVDHPSHRLVAIGLSERLTVFVLYAVALASVATAGWVARSGATALPAALVLIVAFLLGAIHLARVPTYQGEDFAALQRVPYWTVLRSAFLRSHAVQVLLDVILITVCYYAAYRLRFDGEALEIFLPSFAASLPIVLVCKPIAHYLSGLYGRSWSSFGVGDLPAVSRAVVLGTMSSVIAATYLYRFERFSRGVFIIDAVLLLMAILGSRLSFRFMAHAAVLQSSRARRVVICGAGERGRLLAREMLANTGWHMKPVGFIDTGDTAEYSLLGVRVVGKVDDLNAFLDRVKVDELVFSGDPIEPAQRQRALRTCADAGIVVRDLIFEMREAGRNLHGSSVA
jgi:UDP-GlcNAc:undecaprenyl-phosphate/decaprenyl-phosphate GlcNAc-1-phosphate transferase